MTITGINHGLSVYTTDDPNTADNRRLLRPVPLIGLTDEGKEYPIVVSNAFNDATSGNYYPLHRSGHEGIDFACVVGTDVKAMYGGVVIKVERNHVNYGKWVTIRSCTNPDTKAGFEHSYAHLSEIDVMEGDPVRKGQKIGQSGNTPNVAAHLHVHLKAFDANGVVPKKGDGSYENEPDKMGNPDKIKITPVATRIYGCMNFACFLPPDDAGLPTIAGKALGHTGKLLSPRAADAETSIPVYRNRSVSSGHLGTIESSRLGCYAVLEEYEGTDATWYKIQYSSTDAGWVSRTVTRNVDKNNNGTVEEEEKDVKVVWVHVEEATTTSPEVSVNPYFVTAHGSPNIRRYPNADPGGGTPVEGQLTAKRCYAVQGTFEDPRTSLTKVQRRWWRINLTPGYTQAADVPKATAGWVRDDVVLAHADARAVAAAWPPVPRDVRARSVGATVRLDWLPPLPLQAKPPSLNVTGYRIWRHRDPSMLSLGHVEEFNAPAGSTHWMDDTAGAAVSPHALLYYRMAAKVGAAIGAVSGYAGVAVLNAPTVPPDGDPPTTAVPVQVDTGTLVLTTPEGDRALNFGDVRDPAWQAAVGFFDRQPDQAANLQDRARRYWVRIRKAVGGASRGESRGAAGATGGGHRYGWVPLSTLTGTGDWRPQVATLPQPPFARVATGSVPLRPGPSLGYTEALRQLSDTKRWHAIIGKNGAWWRLRVDAATVGWLSAGQVETSGDTASVPFADEAPPPALPGPGGSDVPADAAAQAGGHYLNLANSWAGAWSVSKAGTTVTAAFQSTRSPIQYLARQNPQDLLVLPMGFRPTTTQDIRVTGVHVTENGEDYDQSPQQRFTLRVATTGAVRYVDHAELDHTGYLRYAVGTAGSGTTLTWQTSTAATPNVRPTVGDISQSGTYLNQQVNWGSAWSLSRTGDAVTGSFGCTRSPIQYYANGSTRAAQLLLPEDYRPKANARFQVKGAVRVNEDGSDSTDARKVDFDLTVQPNGEMWYDRDASLATQGVGYVRYTVAVSWTAAPRVQAPSAPRDLEAEAVEATGLELDWRKPADDGGGSIEGYRIEVYRGGRWRTAVSDTGSTRTSRDVEDLQPHTRYGFRVAARNEAGWGPFGPAVSATTRREAPGRPRRLAATAAHDRATLTWQAPASGGRATGYRVARRVGGGRWRTVAADTGSGVTFFADRNVSPATAYAYRVRAHNHGEAGDWSGTATIATAAAPTIPGQVTGLTAVPGTQGQLRLAWTAPVDTGGAVTGYRIERSPDAEPRTWTAAVADTGSAATTWDEHDLAADTAYRYRVLARNSAGTGSPSIEAAGRTRPQLRLDQPVPYPLTAHVEPRADAAVAHTLAFFLPERTCDLTARVPGSDGWWQVLCFDAPEPGPFWLPAAAGTAHGDTTALPQPPAAPPDFAAALANGQVSLGWTAPPAGGLVTGYRLWRQVDDGTRTRLGSDLPATAATYADATVQNGHVYRYRLQALSAIGPGLFSGTAVLAVMAAPAAPDPVPAVNVAATSTALQLSWTRSATGGLPVAYRVRWRVAGTTEAHRETEATGTTHALTDLTPGTAYELRVIAFNQVGEAPAATRTATTVQVAPGVPEAVAVAVTGRDAAVTWQVPATGGPPDAYHLQVRTRTATDWPAARTTVTGLTHTLTGLGYSVSHDLRLRAANTAGESDWVTATFTTAAAPRVPAAPAALQATPGDNSQMQLVWQAPSVTGTGPVTGYRIERSPDVTPRAWTAVAADTGTADTTWHDAGLAADTAYHYRVTGRNAEGTGAPSTEAAGRTRPQAQLRTDAAYPATTRAWPEADATATHTWPAHDDTVRLDVAARSPNDGWWRVLRFGQAADGPYWLSAATVTVTGATGDLPQAPGAPGEPGLQAGHDTVVLTWTAPAHGGTVTGQRLWRQTGEGTWGVLGDDLAADVRTHTDTTVAAATAYRYRVQALAAAGAGPRSAAAGVTTAASPPLPGVPRRLSVNVVNARVRLLWRPPAAGDPVTGYRLWRRTGADGPFARLGDDLGPNAEGGIGSLRTAFDATVAAGATYAYRVQALGAHGAGPLTDSVTVTLPPPPPRAPGAPTGLAGAPGADSQMELAWTAPADPGTQPITGYRIERAADAEPRVWTAVAADTGNTDVAWSDSGLAADTTYHYRVSAINAVDTGEPSSEAAGTTRPRGTLQATATYPLQAHRWPATTAPVTHAWTAHDADAAYDLVARGPDNGWWRLLRFGHGADGPYWVPAGAITVTGTATGLPQVPGAPGAPVAAATSNTVTLTWTAPDTGGTVTGYRLWRQTGEDGFTILGDDLAADILTHGDTTVTTGTAYRYRVQALSAAGAGPRTAAVTVTPTAVPPLVHNYGPGTHTLTVPAGYTALHVQLCGGAGGGGGGNERRRRSGEFGGHGGCTFGSRTVAGGDTLVFTVGRGGAGGDTDNDDPEDGRNGTASTLRHNGTTVLTGDYGRGGDAAVRDTQRAAAGTVTGDSEAFPAGWPGDVTVPQGGARGYWPAGWDGRRGTHGAARVLLV